jgi:hypothetical protein
MPITGRTPGECFDQFEDHLRPLVAATVTATYPLIPRRTKDRLVLGFEQQNERVAVPIDTRFGRLFFYLGQALKAVDEGDHYRLRTFQYWYRVQHDASLKEQARLRWEYDTETPSDAHCRHHTHVPAEVELGDGALDLDKAHLPTGWVTIEELIRFLIVDLGVDPPCGPDKWAALLTESETKFFEDFTSKRHRPPDS